jgi:KDO2-lipid IV(A) lauroyltransferase
VIRPPHEPPPRGKDPAILLDAMARLNRDFESIVRERPEQWLWMHRRWRP